MARWSVDQRAVVFAGDCIRLARDDGFGMVLPSQVEAVPGRNRWKEADEVLATIFCGYSPRLGQRHNFVSKVTCQSATVPGDHPEIQAQERECGPLAGLVE